MIAWFQRKRREAKTRAARKDAAYAILTGAGLQIGYCSHNVCEFCHSDLKSVFSTYRVTNPMGEIFEKEARVGQLCAQCQCVRHSSNNEMVTVRKFAEVHGVKPITREFYVAACEQLLAQVECINQKLASMPGAETPYRT